MIFSVVLDVSFGFVVKSGVLKVEIISVCQADFLRAGVCYV